MCSRNGSMLDRMDWMLVIIDIGMRLQARNGGGSSSGGHCRQVMEMCIDGRVLMFLYNGRVVIEWTGKSGEQSGRASLASFE
jgi:hypothetical protein